MRDPGEKWPPRQPGRCDEPTCSGPVEGKRAGARFCSTECRQKYHHRALLRGARLYEAAIRWRGIKRPGPEARARGERAETKKAFGDMTQMIDEFLREDREMRPA